MSLLGMGKKSRGAASFEYAIVLVAVVVAGAAGMKGMGEKTSLAATNASSQVNAGGGAGDSVGGGSGGDSRGTQGSGGGAATKECKDHGDGKGPVDSAGKACSKDGAKKKAAPANK